MKFKSKVRNKVRNLEGRSQRSRIRGFTLIEMVVVISMIDNYSLDKGHAPQNLDDLVQAGYIKFIPDDITGSNTWQTQQEDPQNAWDPNNTGIASVRSGSDAEASDGRPYSAWDH